MAAPCVLVVDDDLALCEIMQKLLASYGYEVDVAEGGKAALDLVSQRSYDLVLLDYQMPGMNGVEVFRRARALQPDLRGVFLTAFTSINTVFPAIEAGVERILAKPVDVQELIPLMEQLIGPAD